MCRDNALLKIAREAVTEKSKHSGVLNGRFRLTAPVGFGPRNVGDGLKLPVSGHPSERPVHFETCRWQVSTRSRSPRRESSRFRHQRSIAAARMTATNSSEPTLSTHRSRRRFSGRTAGLPWNLTFADAAARVRGGDSSRSRAALIDLGQVLNQPTFRPAAFCAAW